MTVSKPVTNSCLTLDNLIFISHVALLVGLDVTLNTG